MRGGLREMVGAALVERDEVLVVVAEGGGPGQHPHITGLRKLPSHRLDPVERGPAFDFGFQSHEAAAETGLLVHQHHPPSPARRREGRGESGGSSAHHQHVAVGVAVRVGIGVRLSGRLAQARRLANEMLVEAPPRARPHEGLVVEPGRQQARGEVVEGADVEVQRRPVILARAGEPVEELDLGGAQVRLGARAPAQPDERVRLLHPGADHPAAAVVLEAPPHRAHPVGEQRGGDAVAGAAAERAPVELEAKLPAALDEAALRVPPGLAHPSTSPMLPPGGAEPSTSWVHVSRFTLNQRRHPWA